MALLIKTWALGHPTHFFYGKKNPVLSTSTPNITVSSILICWCVHSAMSANTAPGLNFCLFSHVCSHQPHMHMRSIGNHQSLGPITPVHSGPTPHSIHVAITVLEHCHSLFLFVLAKNTGNFHGLLYTPVPFVLTVNVSPSFDFCLYNTISPCLIAQHLCSFQAIWWKTCF